MEIKVSISRANPEASKFARVLRKHKMSVYSDIDSAPYILYKPGPGSKIRETFVWVWRDFSKFDIRSSKMHNRPVEETGKDADSLDRSLSERV